MATIFTNLMIDPKTKKIARKYKINPDSVSTITIEIDLITIDYVEYFKDGEMAFCQKRIQRTTS